MAIAQLEKQYRQSFPEREPIFTYAGTGISSRQPITVCPYLTEPGSGIQFIVSDLRDQDSKPVRIPALAPYVVNTLRNVVLGIGQARLCLIEHFMAAAAFCNVLDLDVIVDGPELPLGDGSAHFWLELFTQAGFKPVLPPLKYALKEAVSVGKQDRRLLAVPADTFSMAYLMDWQHPRIGKRWCNWVSGQSPDDIARARTFGWQKEHNMLGLTDEVVSLTDDGFSKPLLFEDEPVRHKLLDLFGDLTLLGVNPLAIQAQFISIKGGHELDVQLTKELKDKLIEL